MTAPLHFALRPAEPKDHPFIASAWVKEMRHAPFSRHCPSGVYVPCQHALVHQILAGSDAQIACDPANPDHLYGCAVHAGDVVHWLYVKSAYRGLGVGRALLFACFGDVLPEEVVCTQASQLFEDKRLVERYRLVYSPYLLLGIPLPELPERIASWPTSPQ